MTATPPNAETFKTQLPQIIDLFTLDITAIVASGFSGQTVYRFANW